MASRVDCQPQVKTYIGECFHKINMKNAVIPFYLPHACPDVRPGQSKIDDRCHLECRLIRCGLNVSNY